MDNATKQIVFLFLGCLCGWVVLSEFVGDRYITSALATLFPSMVK